MAGSFFRRAGGPHPVLRARRQLGLQFLAPAPDGRFVETRNLGQQPVAAMAEALRLQRHVPAALRFVQPADKHVHAPMQDAIGVVAFLLAVWTLARRYARRCHASRGAVPSRLVASF
jgi:hypothetical protein